MDTATTSAAPKDARKFRDVLGTFTTGVTIITTRGADGVPVGITANSFNSVSLEPPMVLWSLARSARSLEAFSASSHWAVHILSISQEELSRRFARSGNDKFAGLDVLTGLGGTPLLTGCVARLQCRSSFQYEGGDHIIFVGEVLDFEAGPTPPLVFQAGRYSVAAPKVDSVAADRSATANPEDGWSEDQVAYLLGRAYFQIYRHIRAEATRHWLSEADYFTLTTLLLRDGCTLEDLNAVFSYTGSRVSREALQNLALGGLVAPRDTQPETFRLTAKGRELTLRLVGRAEAIQGEALGPLGAGETAALKNLLRRLIRVTDPGLPDLWAPAH
jgi:3-hydroxy-9,10-secoandrosta-1,3,5(10)-triene-9,17-dione monooxygenase reductase component